MRLRSASIIQAGNGRRRRVVFWSRDPEKNEGACFRGGKSLTVFAKDDVGLAAAAEAFLRARPYQWKVPGEKISAIVDAVNTACHGNRREVRLHLTYLHGEQGIHIAKSRQTFPPHRGGLANCIRCRSPRRRYAKLWFSRTALGFPRQNPKPLPALPLGAASSLRQTQKVTNAAANEKRWCKWK